MKRIPEASIHRLNLYLRTLKELAKNSEDVTVSSKQLAEELGINSHQVRKDLSYFGKFGQRGIGYRTKELADDINKILGLNKKWKICLCGLGNLGSALISYRGFRKEGLNVVAVFEKDKDKIGKTINGIDVFSVERMNRVIREKNIEIGIIAVPADAAKSVASQLIDAGIKAILNFAPIKLSYPQEKVRIRNVDLSIELVNLAQFLANISKKS
ncbi:MAG: redox-sensing transcriptional repressor Rex [Candidatus Omnitrophica bacterium]|nr:redox-sensing transcriptional repressor Rex [Candidatus Omnitrophota bacterium]HOX54678.1 redox-sensing transcriptional repressor Rex [Candidatus Omnitrophota bacterium]